MTITVNETSAGVLELTSNNSPVIEITNTFTPIQVESVTSTAITVNTTEVSTLNGLTDVQTTGVMLNDNLTYDGSKFVPSAGFLVLGPSDPIPENIRPGTLIFRE